MFGPRLVGGSIKIGSGARLSAFKFAGASAAGVVQSTARESDVAESTAQCGWSDGQHSGYDQAGYSQYLHEPFFL